MPVSVHSAYYKLSFSFPWRGFAGAVALAVGVAGCAGDKAKTAGQGETIAWSEPGSSVAPVPAGTPNAAPMGPPLNWQASISGDTITVSVRDTNNYYRVERIELTGPNDTRLVASEIDRETNRASGDFSRYGGGPSVGVGGWGGSRGGGGVGVGLGFPLGGSSSVNRRPPVATITTARIRLPDPAFYRQTADNWTIRVTTVDHNNQSSVAVIPAPKPAG